MNMSRKIEKGTRSNTDVRNIFSTKSRYAAVNTIRHCRKAGHTKRRYIVVKKKFIPGNESKIIFRHTETDSGFKMGLK